MVILLGFTFLIISGCRSRTVDNESSTEQNDTMSTDDEWMPAPEYGGPPNDWEEIPEEIPQEVPDEKTQQTETPPVEQPAPGPMEPATAYGTNTNDFNTIINPQE